MLAETLEELPDDQRQAVELKHLLTAARPMYPVIVISFADLKKERLS